MNANQELHGLGFTNVGAICPTSSGTSCAAEVGEVPGYVVYALVVRGRIVKFGKTRTGLRTRMGGHASALRGIMLDPEGHPLDRFKRLAPEVIRANERIEVWAKASAADTYGAEEAILNSKYKPEWVARPD